MSDSDYREFTDAIRRAVRERDDEEGSNDAELDALWYAVESAGEILGIDVSELTGMER